MKKLIAPFVAIAILAVIVSPVFAQGLIRLDPHGSYYGLPIMLSSPATFSVYVQSGGPATDPHIFLVMTDSCHESLTGVTVDGVPITNWHYETVNGVKVPPDTTPGAAYTVASLKDHLNTSEGIWWAFEPFLGGEDITETPIDFTVTLNSDDPRMLVYVLGKAPGQNLFDMFVPPTQPGFVVPELGPMVLALASFAAFAIYALKRRKV